MFSWWWGGGGGGGGGGVCVCGGGGVTLLLGHVSRRHLGDNILLNSNIDIDKRFLHDIKTSVHLKSLICVKLIPLTLAQGWRGRMDYGDVHPSPQFLVWGGGGDKARHFFQRQG